MKQILIFLLLVSLTCHSYGQTYANRPATSEQAVELTYSFDYKQTDEWRKYKIMRAVGWSALGASVPLVFFGVAFTGFSAMYNQDLQAVDLGLLISGGTLLVGSIPVLICAYNYRNKARNMSFGVSAIHTLGLNSGSMAYTPALSLSLSF
ncbi:MAG: hypothetical protein K2L90_11015 [Muribaculaceae bacterium]|nr:hypothetical protein [Muribaculaceae bacterium]